MTVTTLDDSSSTGRTELGGCFALNDVKAGADTVLTEAGSGTLTIAAGKQATIPGWSTLANVTGAGKFFYCGDKRDGEWSSDEACRR